jgi:hypothetical protein
MAAEIVHAMVCSEDKGSSIVGIELLKQTAHFFYPLVDYFDVIQILLGIGSVRMPRRIKSEKVEEKHYLVLSKSVVQGFVLLRRGEKVLHTIKYPVVQMKRILREVFEGRIIAVGIYFTWRSTLLKHGQDVRAPPTPRVPAPVENAVEVHRVELPTRRNSRDIFIKTRY